MIRAAHVLAGVTLLLGAGPAPGPPAPFTLASIHFEQNATDGDFEAVVEAKGGDEGLAKLVVTDPGGRTLIDVTAPAAATLGVRQLRFESPEPGDVASLKAAYPEGVYRFSGTTADGSALEGTATLRHALPPPTAVLLPSDGARGVGARNLVITWKPVPNLAGHIVYIEQAALDVSLSAKLPASVASFAVPAGFLRPGTAYQLGIGTVTASGNISFIETTFTTAEKE